jgi:hypothetical protein
LNVSGGTVVLKNAFIALICTTLLACCGLAVADEYRADEFLGLDLSTAVLSPKLLGPSSEFVPVPIEAKADQGVETVPVRVARMTHPMARVVHAPKERRHALAQVNPARHRRNPLDAQAFDTRIQVWPCKSGGICQWKR